MAALWAILWIVVAVTVLGAVGLLIATKVDLERWRDERGKRK